MWHRRGEFVTTVYMVYISPLLFQNQSSNQPTVFTMAEQQTSDSSKVVVVVSENGVEYSLLKEPNEISMYVMEDHKTLNENLQISELSLELTDVRKHMLIVYCDVIGHLQL